MSLDIPTTKEIKERTLANLESSINQKSPLADKAFLRVYSAVEAMNHTELYKFAVERALQNLISTATGEDLEKLGADNEFNLPIKLAEAAQFTIELPATTGTNIPAGTAFIGDANGARYLSDSSIISAGGVATIQVTAEDTGVSGNLNVSDVMTIETQIPGAETTATITVIDNLGSEKESDTAYRVRLLDEARSEGGGGNTADFRKWAQEVANVVRAYPYSGRPTGDPVTSVPPDRTVYVEADTSIDPDGIAPQSLLDEVRESLTTDPDTGIARQPLGDTDDTLFVESILRTSISIEIRNLTIAASQEAQVKADISTALTSYFRSLRCYVDGLDPVFERNDLITDLTVSDVVQDVLEAAGGSADGVGFGTTPGVFLSSYLLNPGELSKLGPLTYV